MNYEEMLDLAVKELPESAKKKSRFEIPKVLGHIQGNKTVVSNFKNIVDVLHRNPNHVLKFLLKELATPGEIKPKGLILGTKVSASMLNAKIRDYADKYVLCKECGKPDTELIEEKGVTYIRCKACGARYPAQK